MRHFKGTTLVELMVSLAISAFLCLFCIQLFTTIKQIFSKQHALAHIQENARVIQSLLGDAIAFSGNIGCSAFTPEIAVSIHEGVDGNHYGLIPFVPIIGVSEEKIKNNPLSPKTLTMRILSESDIIWIKSTKSKKQKAFKNTVIAVSDCAQVDFIKISDKLEEGILSKKYPENKFVGALTSQLFYVGDTGRKNNKGNPIYALYSTDLNDQTLELAEGVKALKILYGTGVGHARTYGNFEQVTDWNQISCVKVSVLLSAIEEEIQSWWTYEWPLKRKEVF